MSIQEFKTKWINGINRPFTIEECRGVINKIWQKTYGKDPEIILLSSPKACKEASGGAEGYFSLWCVAYAASFDYEKSIGTNFPQDDMETFTEWSMYCHSIHYTPDKVYISQNPQTLCLDERDRLHNENGPAIQYEDGFSVYAMNGIRLNRQIVMEPETQTVEQIQKESNEEVRLIRIERYGYEKYLEAVEAELIDENRNDIEGTLEFLLAGKDITVLLTRCPSTGKRFSLRVPVTIKSCNDAQLWLSSGLSRRIISAS